MKSASERSTWPRTTWGQYAIAVGIVIVATGLRGLLDPVLGDHLPFVTFFIAILVVSWFGGVGASVVALWLGFLLATYFFVPPRYSFTVSGTANIAGLGLYFLVGLFNFLLVRALRVALQRAEASEVDLRRLNADLEQRVAERTHALVTSRREALQLMKRAEDARKKAEQAEAEVRDLYNNAPCGYHSLNEAGVLVNINDTELRWLGYEREDVIGKMGIADIMTSDSHRLFEQEFPLFMARGYVQDLEFELIRKDGTILPVLLSATAIKDLNGHFVMTRSTSFDLTERRKTQRLLTHLAAIIVSSNDVVYSLTLDGAILSWNQAAQRLYGYSTEEAVGQNIACVVSPDRLVEITTVLDRLRQRGHAEYLETEHVRKGGSTIDVAIMVSPIHNTIDRVVGASIICRDITEPKHAQQRLVESLHEKEALLREIHHRVKNNLAVIGSLLYLQSTGMRDEKSLWVLQDCQDRVRSMALVHEHLYRSGDFANVDFATYARDLGNELLRSHTLAPGKIHMTFDLEYVSLNIDRAIPCGLILNELITNALKHAFPSGHHGEITVYLRGPAEAGLVLSVTDDGVGLPLEETPRSTRSLGMRLVRSLTKQLDGRFEFIRRKPGTEARLTLEV
ncbi:MAG TPA: PAS domain S-box protein [Nitrospiraceae bacterium]|nr:PAS domain S-box protein [Nitrospiraceae bacterium]